MQSNFTKQGLDKHAGFKAVVYNAIELNIWNKKHSINFVADAYSPYKTIRLLFKQLIESLNVKEEVVFSRLKVYQHVKECIFH